jgi:hypothetical protein
MDEMGTLLNPSRLAFADISAAASSRHPSACLIQVVFFAFVTHAITPP